VNISKRFHQAIYGKPYPNLGKFEPHFLSRGKFSIQVEGPVEDQFRDDVGALPPDEVEEAKRLARRIILATEFEERIKSDPHCKVIKEVLAETRKNRDDPYWIPYGMLSGGGMLFTMAVKKRLGEAS